MECKFVSCAVALANSLRINRYIMECKFLFVSTACIIVLELIDTLWNVNEVIPEAVQGAPGINRYIMECKCNTRNILLALETGINRYIMECK